MKKSWILCFILLWSMAAHAQLKEAVEALFSERTDDSTEVKTRDTLLSEDIGRQLNESRLNEITLRMELEQLRTATLAGDSLKREKQKLYIDSLRSITSGYPVMVNGDTLFMIYVKQGGHSPENRAETFAQNITNLGQRYNLVPDSVYIESEDVVTDIMYKNRVLLTLTDLDALWQGKSRTELSTEYRTLVIQKLEELRAENSLYQLGKRILYFILVFVIQYILYRLTTYLYRRLKTRIIRMKASRLKPFSIREYELLDTKKQARILIFLANITRYLIIFLQLLITVPILFSIFPQTEDLAMKIFSYLWTPVKSILMGMLAYIPNLFTIFVIWLLIRYVIRGIRYLADEIEAGKLKITGFYPDWALPTYHIVRFLLYAFMIAMIYPYLPGSKSGVFQGISVFVGLIISLGSSTVIGNIIAGLVITYMRPFKLGDRIKLNDTTGNVIEKTPFVTRLRTPKNEMVTIPNSFIMSSHTINYSSSARNFGLIIHSEVTIGYDAPWRTVHRLLIEAAKATPEVISEPEPFVLETSLSDFYPVYQINAYIHDADQLAQIYTDLHQNIQDKFNEAGIEIMSPHYTAYRDGNESTIPKKENKQME